MPTVNEALFDASVKHQIYLQRLSSKTVREILETLVRSEQAPSEAGASRR